MAINHISKTALENPKPFFPREEISPTLSIENGQMKVEATGDIRIFGGWTLPLELEEGKWYRASVQAKVEGIEHTETSVFCIAANHFLREVRNEGSVYYLEQLFRYDSQMNDCQFMLLLRACQTGSVTYSHAEVVETDAPAKRMARIATVKFPHEYDLTLEEQWKRTEKYLDLAGQLHPDLVLLTECSSFIGVKGSWDDHFVPLAESVPDGAFCGILANAAKKHHMYVVGGLTERSGPHVFNIAAVFDREGSFVGRYAKTHLFLPEMFSGVSCGDEYPVFQLDFGKVAIHICYDEWFPEVSRYYARQGAEILLLPVAGGEPITWRTRALDNNLYFVSASGNNPPSMVIDSSGIVLAETQEGVAFADIDLNYKRTHAYIDPTLSYGMPCNVPQLMNTVGWAP